MVRDNWLLFLISISPLSSTYNFNSLIISSYEFFNNFSTPQCMILFIPGFNARIIFTIYFWYSSSNFCFFNASICINHTLIIRNFTAKRWYFAWLNVFASLYERSAYPIPGNFEVTLHATSAMTLVDGKCYFLCHRWLFPPQIYLLIQINSLLSKISFLLLKYLYSLQNISRVSYNYFSDDPSDKDDKYTVVLQLLGASCSSWQLYN